MGLTPPYRGTYVNAESASNVIDAEGIINGANSVKGELSSLNDLSASVTRVASQLGPKDLSIDGVGNEEKVNEVTTLISDTASSYEAWLDGIIANAEAYYNQIQEQYTDDARRRDQIAIQNAQNKNNN